ATPDGESGLARLGERRFDLVLTDLKLPGASGLEVLAASRAADPDLPVVVLTAYGTVRSAVEAMRLGAMDFLEKPVEIDDLFALVRSLVDGEAEAEAFEVPGGPLIVGRHPRMRAALRLLEKVAPADSTVLLTGESGTGKELFAHALHALSERAGGPFVAVNCAAIPEGLLESELFGHEKGAFTGAHRRRSGRFEQAAAGTLLLDEVAELTSAVQGKVLRVLEERSFERVGGAATLTTDARLVAATNRDLAAMVESGEFRADLFYRLDVFPIELPPLRERSSDLPALARHLLERLAERHGGVPLKLDDDAAELLAAQPWPGNVRQLANLLERAVILSERPRLSAADLGPLLTPLPGDDERQRLRRALEEADGDKRRAAELLGVSYRTVLRRVAEYDLGGYPRYRE
ncbi:MAG: sigma-54-dependent transcriptional regulator, partial [Thermoanaerobaculia bacterium]